MKFLMDIAVRFFTKNTLSEFRNHAKSKIQTLKNPLKTRTFRSFVVRGGDEMRKVKQKNYDAETGPIYGLVLLMGPD